MNRKTSQRVRKTAPKKGKLRSKTPYGTQAKKARGSRTPSFSAPELRWVDAVLRSFQEEAPPTWVPFPYQTMLKKYGRKSRKARVLH
jgi:hypothetical protein